MMFKIEKLNNFLTNSIIYTVINFLNKSFPFILLPILTRKLSTEEYGEYSLFRVTASFLLPFIGFNVSEFIMKNYFTKDNYSLSSKLSSGITVNIIFCILMLVGVLAVNPEFILAVLSYDKEYLIVAIIITLFTSVNNIERNILRCQNNIKIYSILVIGQTFLFFVSVLTLTLLSQISLKSIIYAELITYVTFGLVSLSFLWKRYQIKFHVNRQLLMGIFSFCFPLVVNSVLAYMFALSDRFIIAYHLNKHSVGIYNATFQLVSVLQILTLSFNTAWVPFIYSKLENRIKNSAIKRIQLIIASGFFFFSILFYFSITTAFELILGIEYSNGKTLIKWFVLGIFFQLIYWLSSTIIIHYQKNWYLVLFSFIAMLISLTLNILFLEKLKLEFAAFIFCCSWFIMAFMTVIKSQKLLRKNNN